MCVNCRLDLGSKRFKLMTIRQCKSYFIPNSFSLHPEAVTKISLPFISLIAAACRLMKPKRFFIGTYLFAHPAPVPDKTWVSKHDSGSVSPARTSPSASFMISQAKSAFINFELISLIYLQMSKKSSKFSKCSFMSFQSSCHWNKHIVDISG